MIGQKEDPETWGDVGQGHFVVWPIDGVKVVDDEPSSLLLAVRYQTVQLVDSAQVVAFVFFIALTQTDVSEILFRENLTIALFYHIILEDYSFLS